MSHTKRLCTFMNTCTKDVTVEEYRTLQEQAILPLESEPKLLVDAVMSFLAKAEIKDEVLTRLYRVVYANEKE